VFITACHLSLSIVTLIHCTSSSPTSLTLSLLTSYIYISRTAPLTSRRSILYI
jgi:hypothetical protein